MRLVFLNKLEIVNQEFSLTQEELMAIRTLRAFDEKITAPLHGFTSADNYYRISSSRQYLKSLILPTLIIHAADDPFMTPQVIPSPAELSNSIEFELSQYGGHVGFISGNHPQKPVYWLSERILQHIKDFL